MRSRFLPLILIFGVAAVAWSAYLFSIQILDPFNLAHIRRVRYIPRKEILIPQRGSIYDAQGNLLVSSVSYYQIDIDRAAVNAWCKRNNKDVNATFEQMGNIISQNSSLKHEAVMKRLNMGNRNSSIQISNKISETELA